MGLFGKEKTSTDYLKEIAQAQKSEAKIAKQSYQLEKEAIAAEKEAIVKTEQLRIEQQNKELREALLQQVISISFDADEPKSIVQTLTELGAQIDMWLKKTGKYKRHLEAARSKFDMGMSILMSADPNNALLPYFHKKREDWDALIVRRKKTKIRITIVVWVVFLLAIIIPQLLYLDDDVIFAIGSSGFMIAVCTTIGIWTNKDNDED